MGKRKEERGLLIDGNAPADKADILEVGVI